MKKLIGLIILVACVASHAADVTPVNLSTPDSGNKFVATPNGSSGIPVRRAIAAADLPAMTATVGGAVPTPPNNTTTFLRGDGTFAAPAGTAPVAGTGISVTGTTVSIDTSVTMDKTTAQTAINKTFTSPTINGTPAGTTFATGVTASTAAVRDSNSVISAVNFDGDYTTTATAAGTTTLTAGSTYRQYFTGSTTQTVVMPAVSGLTLGHQYAIFNNSTGLVTVQSSGANTIQIMAAGAYLSLASNATSGTGSTVWTAYYSQPAVSANIANTVVLRDGSGNFSAGVVSANAFKPTIAALTDGATIAWDMNNGTNASVTIAGNRTISNPTNVPVGGSGSLTITQDATGSRVIAFGTNWQHPNNNIPVLTTTASAVDVLQWYSPDGTNLYVWVSSQAVDLNSSQTIKGKSLIACALNTPSGITLTNATGLPISAINSLASGVGTWFATPSGANLASALTSALPETKGGTNQTTYATGDILYASASNTLSKRSIGIQGQVLETNGSTVPVWSNQWHYSAKTANYTLGSADSRTYFRFSGGSFAATLPSGTTAGVGYTVIVENNDGSGNPLSVFTSTTGQLIDGVDYSSGSGYRLNQQRSKIELICVSTTEWAIISNPDLGAWIAFTPTATGFGGTGMTFSSVTGRYKQIGKTYFVSYIITVSAAGSGNAFIQCTLPNSVTPAVTCGGLCGVETANNNKMISGRLTLSSNTFNIINYDGSNPMAGLTTGNFVISGTFEAQ